MKLAPWLFPLGFAAFLVRAGEHLELKAGLPARGGLPSTNEVAATAGLAEACPMAQVASTNRSEVLLQQVIALGTTTGDEMYDTNQTEQVLKKVTAAGESIKPDNRWIVLRVLNTNERDLIRGLSAFVKYSRGKFPSSLMGKTISEELIQLTNRSREAGGVRESSEQFEKEFVNALCASGFYEKLVRDKCDPKYYGATATVFDSGAVLVRWKLKNSQYRVLFTDLHAEDVSAARLEELEEAHKPGGSKN